MQMIETYFSTTGELFPYIDKEAFLQRYHELASSNIRTVRRSWLGLLNMILAMSTSASHGVSSNIHGLAVKAAYQLGLHSSDAMRKHTAVEAEIRKRTWFGCVILDRYACYRHTTYST